MKPKSRLFHIATTILIGIILGIGLAKFAGRTNPTKSVAYITNSEETSGGTGFHVRGPSGTMYLVTNGHVCSGVSKDGIVYVRMADSDMATPRRVIQESPTTDLCLVEPMPQAEALSIADTDPDSDTKLEAFGHPRLLPVTHTEGRAIAEMILRVLVQLNPEPGTCNMPKNEIINIPMFFGIIPACIIKVRAIQTTVAILPGSSGSPILDLSGKVRGVAFASDETMWAAMIPVTALKDFLTHY